MSWSQQRPRRAASTCFIHTTKRRLLILLIISTQRVETWKHVDVSVKFILYTFVGRDRNKLSTVSEEHFEVLVLRVFYTTLYFYCK